MESRCLEPAAIRFNDEIKMHRNSIHNIIIITAHVPIAIQSLSATSNTIAVSWSEKYKQKIVGKWKQIKIMFIAFTTSTIDVRCEIIKSADLQFTIIDCVRRLS